MTITSALCCLILVLTEIVFVPLYLKKMWPLKNWTSLKLKMVCATAYILLALICTFSSGGFKSYSAWMFAGFSASWFGDLMLHIPKPTKKFFLAGMLFFMAAHVFFCIGYASVQSSLFPGTPLFTLDQIIFIICLLLVYFSVCLIKKVSFGIMIIPAVIYAVFVTAMTVKSVELGIRLLLSPTSVNMVLPAILLIVGGLSFIQSDGSLALISFDTRYKKFKLKVYNIVTYFLAQVCLAFTIFFLN